MKTLLGKCTMLPRTMRGIWRTTRRDPPPSYSEAVASTEDDEDEDLPSYTEAEEAERSGVGGDYWRQHTEEGGEETDRSRDGRDNCSQSREGGRRLGFREDLFRHDRDRYGDCGEKTERRINLTQSGEEIDSEGRSFIDIPVFTNICAVIITVIAVLVFTLLIMSGKMEMHPFILDNNKLDINE